MGSILCLNDVSYFYTLGKIKVNAVKEVSCEFEKDKIYAIVGRSGSGKTTLMSLLAGLDLPKGGQILYNGTSMKNLDRNKYRRENTGIIYQSFNLFPLLTALENVMYPMQLQGGNTKGMRERAKALLLEMGLQERNFKQFPSMLSGGEQQRVAIARALAINPEIILADEPTGNLDNENSNNIINLLKKLAHERHCCVIIITHDLGIAEKADFVIRMDDGRSVAV